MTQCICYRDGGPFGKICTNECPSFYTDCPYRRTPLIIPTLSVMGILDETVVGISHITVQAREWHAEGYINSLVNDVDV